MSRRLPNSDPSPCGLPKFVWFEVLPRYLFPSKHRCTRSCTNSYLHFRFPFLVSSNAGTCCTASSIMLVVLFITEQAVRFLGLTRGISLAADRNFLEPIGLFFSSFSIRESPCIWRSLSRALVPFFLPPQGSPSRSREVPRPELPFFLCFFNPSLRDNGRSSLRIGLPESPKSTLLCFSPFRPYCPPNEGRAIDLPLDVFCFFPPPFCILLW